MRADYLGMDATPATPRITSAMMRLALATRHGVIVQDVATGTVYAAPAGLSKTETMDPNLVVLLTNEQAASFYAMVGNHYADAAKSATAVIRFEMQLVDARLAEWSAKGGQA